MPRKHVPQAPRRRKAYRPSGSADARHLKRTGVFRAFSSYRLFAVMGALVLFGGYGVSALSGGTISAHGGGGGGNASGVRGEGVRREAPEVDSQAPRPTRTLKQYLAPPPMAAEPGRHYTATITTEHGAIVVELLPDVAPEAVNNFVFLARDGFYDGVTFHRVIEGFVAQAGDPTGTGLGGPGYDLPFEPSDASFEPGVLAAARPSRAGAPNHGSQFFFALGREPVLDRESTVFGRVLSGMDVLSALTPRDPQRSEDAPPGDVIQHIEIIEE